MNDLKTPNVKLGGVVMEEEDGGGWFVVPPLPAPRLVAGTYC